MRILYLLLFFLVPFILNGQDFKFYYNTQGELTIQELATHYRVGKFDLSLGHFVDSVFEYEMNGLLLSKIKYDNGGNLSHLFILNSEGNEVLKFNPDQDKWKNIPDTLKVALQNKYDFKQSIYIRKNYYKKYQKFLVDNPLIHIEDTVVKKNEVFIVVEQPPRFPGGSNDLVTFLSYFLEYPEEAQEKGIKGIVKVQFVILPDGTTTDIKVIEGIGYGCDEAAIKAIELLPDWLPALQHGKPVSFRMALPLRFQ